MIKTKEDVAEALEGFGYARTKDAEGNETEKFGVTVESSAGHLPSLIDFYKKAYFGNKIDDLENFRTITNIKNGEIIGSMKPAPMLRKLGCGWTDSNLNLSGILAEVDALSLMVEVCATELLASFTTSLMQSGSSNDLESAAFRQHFSDVVAMKVNEELEVLKWQGNKTLTNQIVEDTLIDNTNGFLQKINASLATATPATQILDVLLTEANILTKIADLVRSTKKAVKSKKRARIYLSTNDMEKYMLVLSANNTGGSYSENFVPNFLGYKLVEQCGLPEHNMVMTSKENLAVLTDLFSDVSELKIQNLMNTILEDKLRARTDLKIGFQVMDASEVTWYAGQ